MNGNHIARIESREPLFRLLRLASLLLVEMPHGSRFLIAGPEDNVALGQLILQPLKHYLLGSRLHLVALINYERPIHTEQRVAGEGTLSQVHGDLAELEELGCAYVVLDTYADDIEAIGDNEASWQMLSLMAQKVLDLGKQAVG